MSGIPTMSDPNSKEFNQALDDYLTREPDSREVTCEVWDFDTEECPLYGGNQCPCTCDRWEEEPLDIS